MYILKMLSSQPVYVLNFHRDLQMKTTWPSTNTNMRWPWSLAQREMKVSSLLVRDAEGDKCNVSDTLDRYTRGSPTLQTKPLHPPAFWRTVRRLASSMNLQVHSTMTSRKRLKMTLKRFLSSLIISADVTLFTLFKYLWSVVSWHACLFFSLFCSYHWIYHLLQHLSYVTKRRNLQLWTHIETVPCLTLSLLQTMTR